MKERRKFVRVLSNLDLRYKVDEKAPKAAGAKTRDVGGGGIRFLAKEKLAAGTPVLMEIDVPGARHAVTASAQVIWSRKVDEKSWEVATEFTHIDLRDRDKIMKHVFFAKKI